MASVYVGGLGEDILRKDLEREFSRFGSLTKVWVARNPPGFAFINFQKEDDANRAIKEMNGAIINRSKIRVDTSHGGSKRGSGRSGRGGGFCGDHGGRGGFERQDCNFDSGFRHKGKNFLRGGPSSDIAWKPVGVLDCPELVKANEDSSKSESSGKKRKLSGAENISSGSVQKKKACVEESDDAVMNINCLPEEILIKIFHYLSQDELCRIAWVCKWWHKITSYPALWKKIDVLFQKFESQNKAASSLSENIPTCVTRLKLDFQAILWKEIEFDTKEPMEFEKFCITLGKRCPSLKALVLHYAEFSMSVQSVINLCIQYIQNLEILSIRYCSFTADSFKIEYGDHCKIKVLDLFSNAGFRNYDKLTFSKMSSIKKLTLCGSGVSDDWFGDDPSFVDNLEVLNLQDELIHSCTFQILQNHAFKLTELYLCGTYVQDSDFRFSNSVFPRLKTICLRFCPYVTCEALVSLVCSCQSLQNVYVDYKMAASYAEHPFIVANNCKLQIVKITDSCRHFIKDLYEE